MSKIPAFSRHLKEFLEPERGSVLTRSGPAGKRFYRFSNPLMQPYVILAGLAEGRVTDEQVAELQGGEVPDHVPADQKRLF